MRPIWYNTTLHNSGGTHKRLGRHGDSRRLRDPLQSQRRLVWSFVVLYTTSVISISFIIITIIILITVRHVCCMLCRTPPRPAAVAVSLVIVDTMSVIIYVITIVCLIVYSIAYSYNYTHTIVVKLHYHYAYTINVIMMLVVYTIMTTLVLCLHYKCYHDDYYHDYTIMTTPKPCEERAV